MWNAEANAAFLPACRTLPVCLISSCRILERTHVYMAAFGNVIREMGLKIAPHHALCSISWRGGEFICLAFIRVCAIVLVHDFLIWSNHRRLGRFRLDSLLLCQKIIFPRKGGPSWQSLHVASLE